MDTPIQHGMKARTIKTIIRRKVDAWLATVTNEALRERLKTSVIVTGGAIASMLLGDKVNDIDIYLRDHDSALRTAEYYVSKFKTRRHRGIEVPITVQDEEGRVRIVAKSAGIASEKGAEKAYGYFEGKAPGEGGEYVEEIMSDPGEIEDVFEDLQTKAKDAGSTPATRYRPVFLSSNALTLSDKLQIIIRFYGSPDEIHSNYDFAHCTNYWSSWDNELVLRPAALEALLARELKYVGSKYPICSLIRVRKFIQRGWRINTGQILKMCMQISELDLQDPKVLEDQLTGVDTAYFAELMEKMKEHDPDKIDSAYLVEIIDRIF